MATAIELKNVGKRWDNKNLYSDINLKIETGECVGFVGANGTGKSVLFQLMTGLLPVSSGSVSINGKKIGEKDYDFPEDVGILINEPGYIEYYSGYRNLIMLAKIQNRIGEEEVKETMSLVGLDWRDKTPVKKYSMGMKQKLGIAQAIMENQEIVILDEPYNALDFQTNKDITNILSGLKESGRTLLLTSHQHEYLEKLCDRMYCIDHGKLVAFDDKMKERYFTLI